MRKLIQVCLVALFFASCQEDVQLPQNEIIPFEVPSNFPAPHYNLESNPITQKGFELGKKLFQDGRLSSDGVVSCSFCHQQSSGFTHHGHQFSHGVENRRGTRNSQPIQNMAFQKEFGWDGATFHLDLFPIIPITNPDEMNETVTNVIQKIENDNAYRNLYRQAFDNGLVNAENTFKALSQYMLLMVSANSKYDKYIRNEDGVVFNQQETNGMQTFQQKCAVCHTSDLFTDDAFRNNGLQINPVLNDLGRMRVTLEEEDKYKFKVPSLRNVALTAPYMHDGRFGSLESVLNFYQHGVQDTENLDPILKHSDGSLGIDLNEEEKENLIIFLNTLTDEEFINDERFSE